MGLSFFSPRVCVCVCVCVRASTAAVKLLLLQCTTRGKSPFLTLNGLLSLSFSHKSPDRERERERSPRKFIVCGGGGGTSRKARLSDALSQF